MLPRARRLRSSRRVATVFQEGVRTTSRPMVTLWRDRGDGHAALIAIAAARRFRTKPIRNRAKRRLRHAVRKSIPRLRSGVDIVLIARPSSLSMPFADLETAVVQQLQRMGLLNGDPS